MPNSTFDDNQDKRLSIEELRKLPGFDSVNDEQAEMLIDDAIALARMILDIIE
jgi:hypothetical protein